MAVITDITQSKLKLSLQTGVDKAGEPVLKSKTFSNVSPSAVDADLYDAGETIGSLQELPVTEIVRVNEVRMTKQA